MTGNPAGIKFEDHIGLVHMQAMFGYKWATGAGANMDYDDMYQEASLAFMAAANGYDPDTGLKFSAYYTKVAFSHFRQSIGVMTGVKNLNLTQRGEILDRKNENKRRAAAGERQLNERKYGLRPTSFSDMTSPDEENRNFEDTLASDAMTPEQALEFKQNIHESIKGLSPLAQLVTQWLCEPPEALLKELSCQRAHAEVCKGQGVRHRAPREGVTLDSIGKFLHKVKNVPEGDLIMVRKELMDITKTVGV